MKATLKLAPITEPKEGMKVIWKKPFGRLIIYTLDYFLSGADRWEVKESTAGMYKPSELSQIVGEYVERKDKSDKIKATYKKIHTFPVSVDDWEYILTNNLIGKEVDVIESMDFTNKTFQLSLTNPKQEKILYTEEDLQDVVDAWEALPGGREYKPSEIADWLKNHMSPAINRLRDKLKKK